MQSRRQGRYQASFGDWLTLIATLAAVDILCIVLAEAARRHMRTISLSHFAKRCSAVAMGVAAVMIAAR